MQPQLKQEARKEKESDDEEASKEDESADEEAQQSAIEEPVGAGETQEAKRDGGKGAVEREAATEADDVEAAATEEARKRRKIRLLLP